MTLLSRILGYVPKHEQGGIRLEESNPWHIAPIKDPSTFLRHLLSLVPTHSILYLEGTTERNVNEFLMARVHPSPLKVAVGTMWPRPDVHHMPLN